MFQQLANAATFELKDMLVITYGSIDIYKLYSFILDDVFKKFDKLTCEGIWSVSFSVILDMIC